MQVVVNYMFMHGSKPIHSDIVSGWLELFNMIKSVFDKQQPLDNITLMNQEEYLKLVREVNRLRDEVHLF